MIAACSISICTLLSSQKEQRGEGREEGGEVRGGGKEEKKKGKEERKKERRNERNKCYFNSNVPS